MLPLTYLLPIRSARPPDEELTGYLKSVSALCPLVVVDGSPADVFAAAHTVWGDVALHIPPDPSRRCANGKVHGVLTGLDHVATPLLVIADDDVRYTEPELRALVDALENADLVVPQNYFAPAPWHARWDTARTLLNRVTGGDFPGTLGVRASVLRATDGYDGDVLFENLELMRTVAAAGGRCRRRPDLYVRRLPPTARHFVGQRVRQAYDEHARPLRLAVWLAVLPTALVLRRRRLGVLAAAAIAIVLAAEAGRRRDGGASKFHRSTVWFAPLWVAERAVCAWLAVAMRLRGGVPYAGGRLVRAANSSRALRDRHARVHGAER